jgi:3-hydroxyacyl-[acyl-carrier-protein] dehydratase
MSQRVLPPSGSELQTCIHFAAPLVALDAIDVSGGEGLRRISATKRIDAGAPYLQGHFPNFAIFPGIFLIEAVRQAVAIALGEANGLLPEIRRLRSVRFLAPLLPGDSMSLEATMAQSTDGRTWAVEARCSRSDGVTAARLKLDFCYGATGRA